MHRHIREQRTVTAERTNAYGTIWLGDFNRHHPLWDEPCNAHLFTRTNLEAAQTLVDLTVDMDLTMALPKHLLTLHAFATKNLTRTDNVFMSSKLTENLISCMTKPAEQPARANHFPIDTELNLKTIPATITTRRNICEVDWKEFDTSLQENLNMSGCATNPKSEREFYQKLEEDTVAIQETIELHVPLSKPSPYDGGPKSCPRCTQKRESREGKHTNSETTQQITCTNSTEMPGTSTPTPSRKPKETTGRSSWSG